MKTHFTSYRSLACAAVATLVLFASTLDLQATDRAITLTEENGTLSVSGPNASDWNTPTVRPFGESWELSAVDSFLILRNEAAWSEPSGNTFNALTKTAFLGTYYIFSDDPGPVPSDFLTGADSTAISIPYSEDAQGGNYLITFIDKGDADTNHNAPDGGSTALFVGAASLLCFLRKRATPKA